MKSCFIWKFFLFLFLILFFFSSESCAAVKESHGYNKNITNGYSNNIIFPKGWPWEGVTSGVLTFDDNKTESFIVNNNISFIRLLVHIKRTMITEGINNPLAALSFNLKKAFKVSKSLKEHNITTILSISDFPTSLNTCVNRAEGNYWDLEGECVHQIYNFVEHTVKAMKGSHIVAYEFMAEPAQREKRLKISRYIQPYNWRKIVKNIIKKIRLVDKKTFIITSFGAYGRPAEYKYNIPYDDNRMVYNVHMYLPNLYVFQGLKDKPENVVYPGFIKTRNVFEIYDNHPNSYWSKRQLQKSLVPLLEFQKKYNVPIYVGEFGAVLWAQNREQYLTDLIESFIIYNWSWSYFDIGSHWHGFDARYEDNGTENGKRIFKYKGRESKNFKFLIPFL